MARVKSYLRLRESLDERTFVKQKATKGHQVQDKLETTPGNYKTNPKLEKLSQKRSYKLISGQSKVKRLKDVHTALW